MIRKSLVIAVFALLIMSPVQATEVGKVTLPETMIVGGEELILNGAGFRKKAFFKIYVGALYLISEESDPQVIIDNDEPMAIRMHFTYKGVSSQKLVKSWNDGFSNATGGNIEPLVDEIDTFNSYFIEEAKPGDIYDFLYSPDSGVSIILKGNHMGSIPGVEFTKALFGIWLGDKPADKGLKKAMLGN